MIREQDEGSLVENKNICYTDLISDNCDGNYLLMGLS